MCCILFFGLGCSKQTETKPTLSKELYLSEKQQIEIAVSSKTILSNLNQKILGIKKQKNAYTDSVLQNTDFLLQELLVKIRLEDSVSYDEFTNSSEGTNIIQNYKNLALPTTSSALVNSIEGYILNIDLLLDQVEQGNQTAYTDSLGKKLETATLNYENTILNDANLSAQEKTSLFVITTYVLANTDNVMEIMHNLFPEDQNLQKANGQGWRKLKRRIVSAFICIAIGASVGALNAILWNGIMPLPNFIKSLKTGIYIGAATGLVYSIHLMTRNECAYIFNSRILLRPCK